MLTKAFTIPGSVADLKAAEQYLYSKYYGKKYCYAWPELQTPGYALGGSENYYWCAAYDRRVYQLATGFDLAEAVGPGWASCTYLWNFLEQSPSTHTVPPASARFGDIVIQGHNWRTTHTYLVGGTGSSRWLPTSEGDGSSPQFPGSESTGGCVVRKTRDMNTYANHTGMSSGYFLRIWRMPLTGVTQGRIKRKPTPLTVDGLVGDATKKRAISITKAKTWDDAVRVLQESLNKHGYRDERHATLAVDGEWNPVNTSGDSPKQHTTAALQRALGASVIDGVLSYNHGDGSAAGALWQRRLNNSHLY